jgi:hypothetical protein
VEEPNRDDARQRDDVLDILDILNFIVLSSFFHWFQLVLVHVVILRRSQDHHHRTNALFFARPAAAPPHHAGHREPRLVRSRLPRDALCHPRAAHDVHPGPRAGVRVLAAAAVRRHQAIAAQVWEYEKIIRKYISGSIKVCVFKLWVKWILLVP